MQLHNLTSRKYRRLNVVVGPVWYRWRLTEWQGYCDRHGPDVVGQFIGDAINRRLSFTDRCARCHGNKTLATSAWPVITAAQQTTLQTCADRPQLTPPTDFTARHCYRTRLQNLIDPFSWTRKCQSFTTRRYLTIGTPALVPLLGCHIW